MKKLLVLAGVLLVLLATTYFVVTSSGFLKSVVLPRAGAVLNARVEAEEISLSPFSSVEIRKLTVTPNGAERLVSIDLARVRYRLGAILGGTMAIDEVLVTSPTVTVVQKADGTSNLDPILKSAGKGPAGQAPAGGGGATPGKPVQLDLGTLKVENAQFSYRSSGADGAGTTAEVSGVSFSASKLKNGGQGRVEVAANLKLDQHGGGAGATSSGLEGSIQGGFDLGLGADLMPTTVAGKMQSRVAKASGAFKEAEGFAANVGAEATPGEIRQLAVQFARGASALGEVSVRGPFDAAKREGALQVEVRAIDRNVLNLAGAAMGLDFTTTRIDSTNRIELAAGGQRIGVVGGVTGSRVSVKKGELTLPPVDVRKSYDLAIDLPGQTAAIRAFSLAATQGGREFLKGTLAEAMKVSWATNAGPLPDATLDVALTDARLADWSALAGTALQGTLNGRFGLGVRNAGKDLALEATAQLAGFSGTFGSNVVRNLGVNVLAKVAVASFADAAHRGVKAAAEAKDLSGEAAALKFDRYGAALQADLGLPEGQIVIQDLAVRLREGEREGGSVKVQGRWNTSRGGGELTVAAKEINEAALRPFLQAALGDKQLRSVKVTAEATARIDMTAESSVKASAELKDLVVRDPSGTVPESPLAAGLALDASGSAQKLQIRQGELRLTPTARAKNVANLAGDLDFAKTNALKGAFRLTAESLDVTPFVDLFSGGKPAAGASGTPVPAPTPGTRPKGPTTEPEAIQLPIELLTFDAKVGKFYLREVAAEDFVAAVRIAGSRVEVQPLQMALNGAPIKAGAKLNLGVPGYEYDVTFSADKVPFKPLANSFAPSLKDRIEGSLVAGIEVKGAGITGRNLQKNLAGGMQFAVTNANLKLAASGQKPGVLTLLTSLLASTLNIRELKDQPIMDIAANAKMGGGKIDLTEARARSASLEAGTTGSIPIAEDLMQSPLNFPVNIALAREVAVRAKLVASDAQTNAVYVALPALASMKGTLGAPAPEVDKTQAALLAARGIAGLLGSRAGGTVNSVTDLVSGVAKGDTNAVGNLIQGVGSLFGGKKRESEPAKSTAVPAATPAAAKPSSGAVPPPPAPVTNPPASPAVRPSGVATNPPAAAAKIPAATNAPASTPKAPASTNAAGTGGTNTVAPATVKSALEKLLKK